MFEFLENLGFPSPSAGGGTHLLFDKMSRRNSAINSPKPTTLRRSPRFLSQKDSPDFGERNYDNYKSGKNRVSSLDSYVSSAKKDSLKTTHVDCARKFSKESSASDVRSRDRVNSSCGLRRSSRFNKLVDGFGTLRRSPRFSSGGNDDDKQKKFVERVSNEFRGNKVLSGERKSSLGVRDNCEDNRVLSDGGKGEMSVGSSERIVENNKRRTRRNVACLMKESKSKEDLLDGEKGEVSEECRDCRRTRRHFVSPMNESVNVVGEKGKVHVHSCDQKRRTRRYSIGSIDESMAEEVLSGGRKSEVVANLNKRAFENSRRRRKSCVGWMNECTHKDVSSDGNKGEMGLELCPMVVAKSDRETGSCGDLEVVKAEGEERKGTGVCQRNKENSRKRKQGEEVSELAPGWTKEQELALQRAYYAAKPSPLFWKKVAKLVPGKSAQDCFDKVHSDLVTPLQPRPRSRANKLNSSSVGHFSLSASKLLIPTEQKTKRTSCNKRKTQFAQKTVRRLLEKQYCVDNNYEADLFSVLEPNTNLSREALPTSFLSTPKSLLEKQGFLQRHQERSASGHKRPLSRFSCSSTTVLVSPPVLKQVKNKALHEKYIDQLHCREAKRKAESLREEKLISGKENRGPVHALKIEEVGAAKIALASDVRDVIDKLKSLQADPVSNSLDFDHDDVDNGDDEDDMDN